MFALLICIVTGAFALSLLGLALLALISKDPATEMQKQFADVCRYVCMIAIGALVGLLGGRAAAPDRLETANKK